MAWIYMRLRPSHEPGDTVGLLPAQWERPDQRYPIRKTGPG